MSHRVLVVVGTRPEAVKMAPVYHALSARRGLTPVLVSTGQHTDLLRSSLAPFDLTPDHEMGEMTVCQKVSSILDRNTSLLANLQPAVDLVQLYIIDRPEPLNDGPQSNMNWCCDDQAKCRMGALLAVELRQ